MKTKTPPPPSPRQTTILRQLVELIPAYLVPKLAREHAVDKRARTFTPWSHVVTLLYAQLAHALSLNDVCDGLRLWATPLRHLADLWIRRTWTWICPILRTSPSVICRRFLPPRRRNRISP